MSRVVVLTGGLPHAHDFAATGAALADVAAAQGHDVRVVEHPDVAASCLDDGVDVLIVNALHWRMVDDRYDEWRHQWAYSTPATTREAVAAFVAAGGGLLANHTASICFDDWPEWGDVVGGAWRWGVSAHPPVGPVTVEVTHAHPVVADVSPRFDLVDEVYCDLDVRDDVDVLAVARGSADDAPQPVVWAHRYGAGRVVYDALGHDVESLGNPEHARLLRQSLAWIVGRN